jgi:rhamnogalacturonyl hydrolase YesR
VPVLGLFALMALATCLEPMPTLAADAGPSAELSPKPILATMKMAADWQLRQTPKPQTDDWTYGALYAGMMALSQISDVPTYHDAMVKMGRQHDWQPARRIYDADDYCICQTYLELFVQDHDPAMLGPTKERFDYILANPKTNDLHFTSKDRPRWSWCDALFMGPPAWIRLYVATKEQKYLDFMDREWWATSNFLYDTNEHLFYRDSTYFAKREANGQKVFWSRGNGWVLAGLARVLQFLPPDHPHRKLYEQQFREMADKILSLQPAEGLWHPSLLDPESYPLKETSGSGFYTFALAWGINHGLLDRGHYEPAVRKAWTALVQCVTPDGKLEHVQPVGADPKKFDPTHTEVFGVGAFLLAGSEVYRMALKKSDSAGK